MLDHKVFLAAEAAAYKPVFHDNLIRRKIEQAHDFMLGRIGSLVSRVNIDADVPDGHRQTGFRFEERVFGPRRFVVIRHLVSGIRDNLVRVSSDQMLVLEHVGALAVMDENFVLDSFMRREDAGQLFEFDLHELLRLFKRFSCFRRDENDRVADKMGDAADRNQTVPVLHDMTDLVVAGHIRSCEDTDDSRNGLRLFGVDAQNLRSRILRADRAAVQHPRNVHIVRIQTGSENLFRSINTLDAVADIMNTVFRQIHRAVSEHFRRQHDPVDDLLIAGAAADIRADRRRAVETRRIRILVDKPLCRDNHARDAEAALNRAGSPERVGINFLFAVGQTFYRNNFFSFKL